MVEPAGIDVKKSDISLSGRIIGQFPKYLKEEERMPDTLAELGEICKKPEANVIKLPNISASIPQLDEAINELRTKGYGKRHIIKMYILMHGNIHIYIYTQVFFVV